MIFRDSLKQYFIFNSHYFLVEQLLEDVEKNEAEIASLSRDKHELEVRVQGLTEQLEHRGTIEMC